MKDLRIYPQPTAGTVATDQVTQLVSQHFQRAEFACKCGCGFDAVDVGLLTVLENLRSYFNARVIITSGCRCPDYNAKVGGARTSQHIKAKAADFRVRGVSPADTADYLAREYRNCYGIGRYESWTHIDLRPKKARWG